MKLLSILAISAALAFSCVESSALTRDTHSQNVFENETLNYKVMFKWGLINKQAGRATLTLRNTPHTYVSQLTARSESWADNFYCVRDTLNGLMSRTPAMRPISYERIAHEGNDHKHETVSYSYPAPGSVHGFCNRKVLKKDKEAAESSLELRAEGTTVDILTSFYFMRTLPFDKWKPGHKEIVTIFSGKRKEVLTIRYEGLTDLKFDGETRRAYHITFTFTSKGGKKTSDDMEAWISTGKERIPLRMEGKLPVGKVRCIYTGGTYKPV